MAVDSKSRREEVNNTSDAKMKKNATEDPEITGSCLKTLELDGNRCMLKTEREWARRYG